MGTVSVSTGYERRVQGMSGLGSVNRWVAVALSLAILTGCANDPGRTTGSIFNPQEVPLETYPPDQIFERGEYELNRSRPQDAASISTFGSPSR